MFKMFEEQLSTITSTKIYMYTIYIYCICVSKWMLRASYHWIVQQDCGFDDKRREECYQGEKKHSKHIKNFYKFLHFTIPNPLFRQIKSFQNIDGCPLYSIIACLCTIHYISLPWIFKLNNRRTVDLLWCNISSHVESVETGTNRALHLFDIW